MDPILEKEIKEEVFIDDCEYFFNFLTDRFEPLGDLWIKALEKKFNKKFKPIWILSAKQNEFFKKENYIVINKKLKEIKKKLNKNNLIYLQDYEDLNKEFSQSSFVSKLIDKFVKKQGRVFILGFTSSFLNLQNSKAIILGPKPDVATKYDSKIEQIKLFEELKVPRNNTRIHNSIKEVRAKEQFPYFISAAYTSGGNESGVILDKKDLDLFYSKLRLINKMSPFFVANLITDIFLSPNVNALVLGKNSTEVLFITDQILRDNAYLGNIYPSKASKETKEKIIETTKVIGNHLSNLGFRGLFGLDFLIDSNNKLSTIDLNPRRQGGYLCNVLASKSDIIDLELRLALGEIMPLIRYEDFQQDFAWAHTKIKPYFSNMKIKNTFFTEKFNAPFTQKGSTFKCIFYPKDFTLMEGNGGYLITSGNNYEEVKNRLIKEVEVIISKDFSLYQGTN